MFVVRAKQEKLINSFASVFLISHLFHIFTIKCHFMFNNEEIDEKYNLGD